MRLKVFMEVCGLCINLYYAMLLTKINSGIFQEFCNTKFITNLMPIAFQIFLSEGLHFCLNPWHLNFWRSNCGYGNRSGEERALLSSGTR